MIQFNNVTFSYDNEEKLQCLNKFNLQIKHGECILLCGPSGCGKSTVTRLVNGLIPHFYEGEIKGQVLVDGKNPATEELYDMAKVVGTVFQNPRSQFYNVDTTSELCFGCENEGLPVEVIRRRMAETIETAKIEKLMDRNIFELSGGEKQKIACACVMTSSPDVIVLDEPSANLDQEAILDLKEMIKIWRKQKKTILIAEHRLSYCLELVDRVIIMENGTTAAELSQKSFRMLQAKDLQTMGLRALECKDAGHMTMKKQDDEYMVVKNMKFGYTKNKLVLNMKEIRIPVGEIVAIVGKNGVGKSTFLKCLCGIERKCKATLSYKGKEYGNRQRLKLIYMVMQDVNHQLFTESVVDEIRISMKEEDEGVLEELLERLDLKEYKDRHPVSLSGGQKQRVAVASAFASNREIILFDEPTSGLDYGHMIQVSKLLRQLKEEGKTVLVVTHDSELIETCCTRVIHLEQYAKGEVIPIQHLYRHKTKSKIEVGS